MKRILQLSFLIMVCIPVSVFSAQIPPFYLDSTVIIGIPGENNTVKWTGSGFILGTLIDKVHIPKQYRTYLVTNKHVLNNLDSIYVRFNSVEGSQGKDYLIPLKENKNKLWVGHHDNDIDVAVLSINTAVLKNDKMIYSFVQDDAHVYKIRDLIEAEVTEGDPIYLLGYPLGIIDNNSQYVIARFGIIAKIRDMLKYKGKGFLIDTKNYPGNSGGPVILKPEPSSIEGTKSIKNAQVIGIVSSYIPYIDVAISSQTNRPRITFEENSGLANVIPVDYILETIKEFDEEKNRGVTH